RPDPCPGQADIVFIAAGNLQNEGISEDPPQVARLDGASLRRPLVAPDAVPVLVKLTRYPVFHAPPTHLPSSNGMVRRRYNTKRLIVVQDRDGLMAYRQVPLLWVHPMCQPPPSLAGA